MKPLVQIIDDDAAIRDSIRALLASVAIDAACHATARAFFDAPLDKRPGCILLDLRMPDMSGLEIQQRHAARAPHKPIIFLSGHGDVDVTVRAMQQGAADFLTKPVSDETLLDRVRAAIERDRRAQAAGQRQAAIAARLDVLSPRESEVLDAIIEGCSNKQTAQALRISPKTVELHRRNVMAKMHADSLARLVAEVTEWRLGARGGLRQESSLPAATGSRR